MNRKYKSLLKDTLIFALGSLGSKIILFFLVPLYTNYLTTYEYGIAELVSTFSQLIIPISSLVIGQAVIRFGMMKSEKPENVAVAAYTVLGFSVVVAILLIPVMGLYSPVREWRLYLCMQVILSNFTEVEKTYLKVKDRNKLFSIISIIQTAIIALTNVLLLTVFHFGVKGYLIANILGAAAGTILAFFGGNLHCDLKRGKLDMALLGRMIAYSTPLIFGNISWWVIHSSDKIMIEAMIGASTLGIYTAATKIPSLINVIIGIFNQAWGISSIKEIESTGDTGFYTSVFRFFSTFLFGVCIVFIAFVRPFMNVYVGIEFREAWKYTPLLLSAAVFYSIYAFVGTLYSALKKTKHDMWTSILCAVINVVVNYFGIMAWGVWGAIVGTVVAYGVCAHVRILDITHMMKFGVDLTYWVNAVLLISFAIAISVQWHPVIISFGVVLVFLVINVKVLKKCVKGPRGKYEA
ncbi:MAG: oligosaccharide flippase family protein [Lachnospiraceae bacterium]|nr:oligosaccharide flippase family protein [Lachnospiraceae bacterium]